MAEPSILEVGSTDMIRTHFPALERRYNDYPVAYFDGPGGTQIPRAVVDAMADYLYHHNANTHWAYPTSAETDAALEDARRCVAAFLNASPEEVAFGNNMTTLTFHLARALGRRWGPGDEVVVTELDHHANVAPWHDLPRERGITVHTARMNPATGLLDRGSLERLLGPRTRLLAIGAASNALGTINDIQHFVRQARAAGALTFVDAVHYASHALVDVQGFGCDLLACSAYKFYGPHAGVLYGRKDLLEALAFPRLLPAPDTAPERAETGTQNHEGIVGTAAAIDFLAAMGHGASRRERLETAYTTLHERGTALVTQLWKGLSEIDGVTLYGPPPDAARTPTVAFTMNGHTSEAVAQHLAEHGLFLSHGDFYAATVVEKLGVEGLVRAGCACYTTPEEVDRLVEGVRTLR